jgi:uncharacterized protein (TIGR00266 family)
MGFCTSCGAQLSDGARFCPKCGASLTGAPAAPGAMPPPPVPNVGPLDYKIVGDNLQVVRVNLKPGQELYAEAGKMLYKTPNIQWETKMSGASVGEKLWGALKRTLMGESLFLTYFRASSLGDVGFAGNYPGRIQPFDLRPGQTIMVQRDSFLAAQTSVTLNIAFVKKLGTGFFGGEGFILEKLTGPGTVFIHGGGDFIEFDLKAGEMLHVDTGCIVAFDESVQYDIQFVGGIKKAIFGGEGLFLATLQGPGRCIVQSMTLEKMRRELAPTVTGGGDERSPLGALGGIFSSED